MFTNIDLIDSIPIDKRAKPGSKSTIGANESLSEMG
jgi:hypothetical protein